MAIAPDYAGGIQPAVGVGTEGARFKEQVAPRADFSPFFAAWKDVAGVAAKELDDANDALFTAKDAELRKYLIRQKQDKDEGYLNLHEENALKPDEDGASLPDRVLKNASDYRESLMDGWSTAQKAAFRERTKDLLVKQYGDASEHLFKENEKYRISASNARAQAAILNAQSSYSDPSAVEDALRVGEEEARKQASINGLSREDTEYAVKRMRGLMLTKIVGAAVDDAERDDQAIFVARALIDRHGKDCDPDAVIKLNAVIQKKFDSVETSNIGKEAYAHFDNNQKRFRLAANMLTVGEGGSVSVNSAALDISSVKDLTKARGVAAMLAPYVISTESNGQQFKTVGDQQVPLTSDKGAVGIMQLTPGAVDWVARKVYGRAPTSEDKKAIQYDANINKQFGTDYLALMIQDCNTIPEALASYNWGPNAVKAAKAKYGSAWLDHAPTETKNYVRKIMSRVQGAQVSALKRPDGTKISAMASPQEYAREYFKSIPTADLRAYIKAHYPQCAASEAKLDLAVAAAEKEQKLASDAFATEQTNINAALIENYGKTGRVDQTLLNRLTIQGQIEFQRWRKSQEEGDTSGDLRMAAILDINPGEIFQNKATNQPISQEEATAKIAMLPKADRARAWKTYYQLAYTYSGGANGVGAGRYAAEHGNIDLNYFGGDTKQIIEKLAEIDPDNFGTKGRKGREDQLAIANAIRWSLADKGMRAGSVLKPGTPEFDRQVNNLWRNDIDVASMFSGFGVGPSRKSLMDFSPSDLPTTAPSSAGRVLEAIANDYVQERYGGTRAATDAEKKEVFLRLMLLQNPGIEVKRYKLDDSAVRHINEQFVKDFNAKNHRDPTAAEMPDPTNVLKEYFRAALRGDRWAAPAPAEAPGGYISNGNDVAPDSGDYNAVTGKLWDIPSESRTD